MASMDSSPPLPQSPGLSLASPPRRWLQLLVSGACFGLGYGLVHRLMDLELPQFVQLGQPFEVRPFPGTTLESLRLRLGAGAQSIRGDLGQLELEAQQRQDEASRRQAAAEVGQNNPADPGVDPPEPVLPAADDFAAAGARQGSDLPPPDPRVLPAPEALPPDGPESTTP